MATLKDEHKRFIIRRLAVFVPPSDVQTEFEAEYGFEVSSGQVAYYDPTNERGRDLAGRWRTLFHETRQVFLEDFTESTLQYKAVRLREMEKQYRHLEELVEELPDRNAKGRAELIEKLFDVMEQVAKEMGGKYTNSHTLDASVSNPNEIDWDELSDEQIRRIVDGEPLRDVLADSQ